MRVITRQSKANIAYKSWKEQYASGDYGDDKLIILRKLKNIGINPDPDEVNTIIGNNSWTRTTCHECNRNEIDVVEVGEPYDYESSTACICKKCLIKALEGLQNEQEI